MAKVDYDQVYKSICERVKKKGDTPVVPDIEDNRLIGETKSIIANHIKNNIEKLLYCDSMILSNFHSRSRICDIEIAIAKLFCIDFQYEQKVTPDKILKK